MKFVLTTERRATMTVEALLPTDKGTKAKVNLKVTYRILDDEVFQEMVNPVADPDLPLIERLAHARRNVDAELLRQTVIGWDSADLVDEAGEPVPFSAEALETLLRHVVPLRAAMAEKYVEAHQGEAKRKN